MRIAKYMPKKDNTRRAKKFWLASNLAEVMVLFNGLIITITAFIIFGYFIKNISIEEYKRTSDEIGYAMVESVSSLENSIRLTASIIELSQNNKNGDDVIALIRKNISDSNLFDQLIWLYEATPGKWKTRTIYGENVAINDRYNFTADAQVME
ncbi:MAG: hypothetical protein EOM23_11440, partial [Candidatus Moranbacteria bacterium]|nr:hypothetical protein [Candidatus Moranbacteria bacterium]